MSLSKHSGHNSQLWCKRKSYFTLSEGYIATIIFTRLERAGFKAEEGRNQEYRNHLENSTGYLFRYWQTNKPKLAEYHKLFLHMVIILIFREDTLNIIECASILREITKALIDEDEKKFSEAFPNPSVILNTLENAAQLEEHLVVGKIFDYTMIEKYYFNDFCLFLSTYVDEILQG